MLRSQGMGGRLSGGIVAGKTGKFQTCIHLNLRFPKRVSARNMSGYMRWSKEGRCMKILYFKVRLSTRTALFMDRCHNFALVSTEMPLFMDITPNRPFCLPNRAVLWIQLRSLHPSLPFPRQRGYGNSSSSIDRSSRSILLSCWLEAL